MFTKTGVRLRKQRKRKLTKEQEQKNNSHAVVRPCTTAVVSGGKKNLEIYGNKKICYKNKIKNNGVRANGI
jgi:hypothetical protein